jgi:hypothetical protein
MKDIVPQLKPEEFRAHFLFPLIDLLSDADLAVSLSSLESIMNLLDKQGFITSDDFE